MWPIFLTAYIPASEAVHIQQSMSYNPSPSVFIFALFSFTSGNLQTVLGVAHPAHHYNVLRLHTCVYEAHAMYYRQSGTWDLEHVHKLTMASISETGVHHNAADIPFA